MNGNRFEILFIDRAVPVCQPDIAEAEKYLRLRIIVNILYASKKQNDIIIFKKLIKGEIP